MLNKLTLALKNQVYSMGVLLDSALGLNLCSGHECTAHLKLVCQLQLFLKKANQAVVTYALVTTSWNYCNVLYMGLHLESVQNLQHVQNVASRLLTGASYIENEEFLQQQLH